MKKLVSAALLAGALLLGSAGAASAHFTGPCGEEPGDFSYTGREYATHHIAAGAHLGIIGQGHKPGTHHGYSFCVFNR